MGSKTQERARDQTQGELSSLHRTLPLAIRMEGNTIDGSEVTLDSSKFFFKGQVEEPGGGGREGKGHSPSSKACWTYHSPKAKQKVGNRDEGECEQNKRKVRLDPARRPG